MKNNAFVFLTCFSVLALGSPAVSEEVWKSFDMPTTYPEPVVSGYTDVNSVSLFSAEWGEGDPVLLLHGGLGSIEGYALQIPALAESYHVIAIDSRGHGRSSMNDDGISYELLTSDVIAFMDAKGIDSAAVVGWSDGGIIAIAMALEYPSRLSKAMLMGSNYNISGVDPTAGTNEVVGAFVGAAAEAYGKISPTPENFGPFSAAVFNMWGTEPTYTDEDLQRIDTPMTVLHFLEDEAILDEHADRMAEMIPGANYIVMDELSHFGLWQDPDRVNAAILEFLAN